MSECPFYNYRGCKASGSRRVQGDGDVDSIF
jgi:hypothetical protein